MKKKIVWIWVFVVLITGIISVQLIVSQENVIHSKEKQKNWSHLLKESHLQEPGFKNEKYRNTRYKVDIVLMHNKGGRVVPVHDLAWNLLRSKNGKYEKMSELYELIGKSTRLRFGLVNKIKDNNHNDGLVSAGSKYKLYLWKGQESKEYILKIPTMEEMKRNEKNIKYFPIVVPNSFLVKEKKKERPKKTIKIKNIPESRTHHQLDIQYIKEKIRPKVEIKDSAATIKFHEAAGDVDSLMGGQLMIKSMEKRDEKNKQKPILKHMLYFKDNLKSNVIDLNKDKMDFVWKTKNVIEKEVNIKKLVDDPSNIIGIKLGLPSAYQKRKIPGYEKQPVAIYEILNLKNNDLTSVQIKAPDGQYKLIGVRRVSKEEKKLRLKFDTIDEHYQWPPENK